MTTTFYINYNNTDRTSLEPFENDFSKQQQKCENKLQCLYKQNEIYLKKEVFPLPYILKEYDLRSHCFYTNPDIVAKLKIIALRSTRNL